MMKDIITDKFIKCLIEDFKKYQEELLTGNNNIKFSPEEEDLIIYFLNNISINMQANSSYYDL